MAALLIFAVAFAVRLLHIWQIRSSPFFDTLIGDANGYDLWAQRLAGGDWVGTEVFYQAPLYPYFLGAIYSIFGRDLLVVRIIQALIGSASCVFLGLAGARLFSKPVGVAAGLALALWAPAIFFDGVLQKSVLDMFFVCVMLWLIAGIDQATTWRWLGLGVTMGGLALTRENALLLIAVIAIAAVPGRFYRRSSNVRPAEPARSKRRQGSTSEPINQSIGRPTEHTRRTYAGLAYFVLGLAVVLLPVMARNYSIDGGFYLTTSQFGSNFYIGNTTHRVTDLLTP